MSKIFHKNIERIMKSKDENYNDDKIFRLSLSKRLTSTRIQGMMERQLHSQNRHSKASRYNRKEF